MALTTETHLLPVLEAGSETGWDPGPFTAVLQCLHLDIPLLENKIKENCMGLKTAVCTHSWGRFWDPKDNKETKKTTLLLLKSPAQKQSTVCALALDTT